MAARGGRAPASFTGIGAFSDVTLRFFERERRDYRRIAIDEQVEVLLLAGDIAQAGGEPHGHVGTRGGRLDGPSPGIRCVFG